MEALLKEKIRNYRSISFRLPPLPKKLKTEEKALELGGFATDKPISSTDLEECYHRLLNALDTGDWQQLTQKDWKHAVYVMWYGDRLLAAEPVFRAHFHSYLRQKASGLRWKSFIRAYLVHFKRHGTKAEIYREFTGWIMQGIEHPSCYLWKHYHRQFQFFNTRFSVEKMAETFILQCHSEWSHFIQHTGMTGELATCEYMQVVAAKLLQWLHHVPDKASQILPFFEDKEANELRFAMLHPQLIDALLLPWRDKKPPPPHQHDMQQWLLTYFGDPRLRMRQHQWLGVCEDSVAVMRKWLAGADIKAFFEIIDQNNSEQWAYRRAFWEVYIDHGYVDGAWVVLGSIDANRAYHYFKDRGAGRVKNVQSVLLVKIHDYVFAEWTRSGRCRAWSVTDEFCPKLYQDESNPYDAASFSQHVPSMQIIEDHQGAGISHIRSSEYWWQTRLSEFIYHNTGIKVDSHAYRI
jgi:hypothetical protein